MAYWHGSPDYHGWAARLTRDERYLIISTSEGALMVDFSQIPELRRELEQIENEIFPERAAAKRPGWLARLKLPFISPRAT
jgi:hypothetical protein